MGQKWIIDVLSDLRVFADQNGLPLLAHQLDITSTIAQAEIASLLEGTPRAANVNGSQTSATLGDTRSSH
ncbi:MAG: hypothetical protein AAGL89_04100 [Pseudomonadota bacterium]